MKAIIRSILQTHLTELGKFNTAWEGVDNKVTVPYQAVFLNISTSQTSSISDRTLSTETGFLQVTLFYPMGKGTKAIEQRASDIRSHFYGLSVIEDGVQVVKAGFTLAIACIAATGVLLFGLSFTLKIFL